MKYFSLDLRDCCVRMVGLAHCHTVYEEVQKRSELGSGSAAEIRTATITVHCDTFCPAQRTPPSDPNDASGSYIREPKVSYRLYTSGRSWHK